MTEHWAEDLVAKQDAPSKPYLTDQYDAVDRNLWEKVMQVAKGERRYFTRVGPNGERTINAPNNGQGFRKWPSQKAVAWAIKQYKGFGGQWRGDKEAAEETLVRAIEAGQLDHSAHIEAMSLYQREALDLMHSGSLITTKEGSDQHYWMLDLHDRHLVSSIPSSSNHVWDLTAEGARVFVAGLEHDLVRKMDHLLNTVPYDGKEAVDTGKWFEANFRFKSPKTPKGQKDLKEWCDGLHWALVFGTHVYKDSPDAYRANVEKFWGLIKPRLGDLVRYFSDEGGTTVPAELKIGANTYLNRAGLDAKTLDRYAHRLNTLIESLGGWRAKALKGGVKIAFASPKEFHGTVGGKYKSNEDLLLVRTTPAVLKRGEGYGSFDYIIIHELGHRYSYKNSLPTDFDRVEWYTSRYSYKEGETFAELFAIGHYGLKGAWSQDTVDRFEKVMHG